MSEALEQQSRKNSTEGASGQQARLVRRRLTAFPAEVWAGSTQVDLGCC